jgi:hypothetical protein
MIRGFRHGVHLWYIESDPWSNLEGYWKWRP